MKCQCQEFPSEQWMPSGKSREYSRQSVNESQSSRIMQRINLLCLILSGVCVVIMCVGIGIAISSAGGKDDTDIEYDEYGEDYVLSDHSISAAAFAGGVIDGKSPDQGTTERFVKYKDSFMT